MLLKIKEHLRIYYILCDILSYIINTPGVIFEKLQDGNDNVVDVAETAGLKFPRMVEATAPVDLEMSEVNRPGGATVKLKPRRFGVSEPGKGAYSRR